MHDKVTFLFELRHATIPKIGLAAQQLQPICCHLNISSKIDTTITKDMK